jgi:hypothetical protein
MQKSGALFTCVALFVIHVLVVMASVSVEEEASVETVNCRACILGAANDVTAVIKAVEDRNPYVSITYDADIAGVDWTTNAEAWKDFFERFDREDAHVHFIITIDDPQSCGGDTLRALARAAAAQGKGVRVLPHARSVLFFRGEYTRNRDASKCLCAKMAALQAQATAKAKAQAAASSASVAASSSVAADSSAASSSVGTPGPAL